MMRSSSVLPVMLLAIGTLSPATALCVWMLTVLLANITHLARRRDSARALTVAAATAAPLLWFATLGTQAAAIAVCVSLVIALRHTVVRDDNRSATGAHPARAPRASLVVPPSGSPHTRNDASLGTVIN